MSIIRFLSALLLGFLLAFWCKPSSSIRGIWADNIEQGNDWVTAEQVTNILVSVTNSLGSLSYSNSITASNISGGLPYVAITNPLPIVGNLAIGSALTASSLTGQSAYVANTLKVGGSVTGEQFISIAPACAFLYQNDEGATSSTYSPGLVYTVLTNWSLGVTNHVTVNKAAGTVTIPPGFWDISLQFSFSGTANASYECSIFIGGVESVIAECERKLGAGGDVGSASFTSLIYTPTNVVLDIRAKSDSAIGTLSLHKAQFKAIRR